MLTQTEMFSRVAALESRLQQLCDRVARLEGTSLAPIHFSPVQPPAITTERRRAPHPICQRCGVGVGSASGFHCPYQDCPSGFGDAPTLPQTAP